MTIRNNNKTDAIGANLPGIGRQRIEGNPLTSDEIAMFERFEREAWSPERRRSHIISICNPGSSASDR